MGTIFVAGTYGVGKSTLCNKLSTALKIPDFSAGDPLVQSTVKLIEQIKWLETKMLIRIFWPHKSSNF